MKIVVNSSHQVISESVIKVQDLVLQYGNKEILKIANWEIFKGDCWIILGKNGVGKSTLLKTVFGQQKVANNKIFIKGQDINLLKQAKIASEIGFLSQKNEFFVGFNVIEFLQAGMYAYKGKNTQNVQIENVLKELDLWDLRARNIMTLSGGELQKMLFASVLAVDPEIIVMDEPFSFLDPSNSYDFANIIERYLLKKTIIMVLNRLEPIINTNIYQKSKALLLKDKTVLFQGGLLESMSFFEELYNRKFLKISNQGLALML